MVILNYTPESTVNLAISSLQRSLDQIGPGLRLDEAYVRQMHSTNHWAIIRYASHLTDIKHPGYIVRLKDITTFGTFFIAGNGTMAHLRIYPTVSMVNVDNPRQGSHKCFLYPLPCGIDIAKIQNPKKYPPLAAFRRFSLYKDKDAILSAQFLSLQDRLDSNLTKRGSFVQLLVPYYTEAIHVTSTTRRQVQSHYEHPSYDPTSKTMIIPQLVSEVVFLSTEDDINDGLLSPTFQMVKSKIQEQVLQQSPAGQATHPILHIVHEAGFCFEMAPSYDIIVTYRRKHPATKARELSMIYHVPSGVVVRDLLTVLSSSAFNKLYMPLHDMALVLPPVEKGNIPWRLALFMSSTFKPDLLPITQHWQDLNKAPVNRTVFLPGEETFFQLQSMIETFDAFPDRRTDKPACSKQRSYGTPINIHQDVQGPAPRAPRIRVTHGTSTVDLNGTPDTMDTDTTFSESNPMNNSVSNTRVTATTVVPNTLELGLLSPESTEILRKLMKDISIEQYSVHAAAIEEQSRRTVLLESSIAQLRSDQTNAQALQTTAVQATTLHRLKQEVDLARLSFQALIQTRRNLREDIRLYTSMPPNAPGHPDDEEKAQLHKDITAAKQNINTEKQRIDDVLQRVRTEAQANGLTDQLDIPQDF